MHVNVCDLFTGLFVSSCCFSLKLYDTYFTYVIIHRILECDMCIIYIMFGNSQSYLCYLFTFYFTVMILFAIYSSPKTCDNIEVLKDLLESFGMQHT